MSQATNNSTTSSPFSPTTTYTGKFNPTHTTNASIVYDPRTVPDPWPYLAASFGLSVLSFIWAMYGPGLLRRLKKKNRPVNHKWSPSEAIKLVVLAINTIRSVAAFVIAIKAIKNNGARFASPTALAALLLAVIPHALDSGAPHGSIQVLGMMDVFLVFTALCIMVYGRFKGSALYYGKFFLEGGTCPVPMHGGCQEMWFVGCNSSEIVLDKRDINGIGTNYVAWSEVIVGSLMFFLGIPVLLAALLVVFMLVWGLVGLVKYISRIQRTGWLQRSRGMLTPGEKLKKKLENEEVLANFGAGALLVILVFAAISIPIHYFQLTRPKAITLIDGGGPSRMTRLTGPYQQPDGSVAYWNYTAENGSSWSDCFTISPAHDKNGFAGLWWEEHKKQIETILAVV